MFLCSRCVDEAGDYQGEKLSVTKPQEARVALSFVVAGSLLNLYAV